MNILCKINISMILSDGPSSFFNLDFICYPVLEFNYFWNVLVFFEVVDF